MSKKQITIDPSTLGVGVGQTQGPNTTMKPRKIKPAALHSSTVKKNLLAKIKDFKRRSEETPFQNTPVQQPPQLSNNELANQFKMSSNYLEQLINKKKESRKPHKPKTPKQQTMQQPVHPMQMQPVQMPPVQMPPVQMQPVQMPPVQMPPVQMQPVQMQPMIEVSLDLPPELQTTPFYSTPSLPVLPPVLPPVLLHKESDIEPALQPLSEPVPNPIVLKDVPYGCLRGGNKPTYRTYHRNMQSNEDPSHQKTMKKAHINPNPTQNTLTPNSISVNPNSDPEEDAMIQERQRKLRELQEKAISTNATNATNNTTTVNEIPRVMKMKNKIKTTTTKKYKLGRTPGSNVVGVLIKNNETRSRVTNDLGELKRENIIEIRKYLHNHGLLKVGSDAPPDVLRNMYETAKLTGEVNNINKQVLLHNFIANTDNAPE
jgi:hypothetical protein